MDDDMLIQLFVWVKLSPDAGTRTSSMSPTLPRLLARIPLVDQIIGERSFQSLPCLGFIDNLLRRDVAAAYEAYEPAPTGFDASRFPDRSGGADDLY